MASVTIYALATEPDFHESIVNEITRLVFICFSTKMRNENEQLLFNNAGMTSLPQNVSGKGVLGFGLELRNGM